MANLVYFVLLVVASSIFAFPNIVEALTCKCTPGAPHIAGDCKNGAQSCPDGTTECYKLTEINKPGYEESQLETLLACNQGNKVPPDGTCIKDLYPTTIKYICFCKADMCDPPDPPSPTTRPNKTTIPPGNGNMLRSWSWLPLSIFASSAIIVPTFVGGQ